MGQWSLQQAVDAHKNKKKKKVKKQFNSQVVIPYMEGVSERVDRMLMKHKAATDMHPQTTLRQLLVHSNVTQKNRAPVKLPTPSSLKEGYNHMRQ